jgi:nitrite reductase/ring-hydroxylating ferredoxin subunit
MPERDRPKNQPHDHDCGDCALARAANRRDFLRDAATAAIALLVSLGASRADAARAPLRAIVALGRRGNQVRYSLPAQDGVEVDAEHDVILVRHGRAVYALARSCPHQRVAVRWQASEGRFQCPKHKSRYQPDGTFISGRATRHMDRLPIAVAGTELVVTADAPIRADRDAAAWAAALVQL